MSLPVPEPYAFPLKKPGFERDWAVDPERSVLLVQGMQNYFLDPLGAEHPALGRVIAHIRQLIALFRRRDLPVIFTVLPPAHDIAERGLLAQFWGSGPRTEHEARILPAVAPEPGEAVLKQRRYSGFRHTDLAAMLTGYGRDQLIITGAYARVGSQATAVDAFMADIEAFIVADAVVDRSLREHEAALEYVAQYCGVVTDTARIWRDMGR